MRDFAIMRQPAKSAAFPPKSPKRPAILHNAIYLDTETSHVGEDKGWIYQWALDWCDEIAIGRKPSQLLDTLNSIAKSNHLGDATKCIVYVHNLSYDIQYLKDWLISVYGDYKILATDPHKFITFECGPFVWKCSYRLSGRSLAAWGSDLGISNTKKSGLIDYNVIRYQDSKLSRKDWIYMLYDIWALKECIEKENELENDNINTVPLTSTAYVRRDARKRYKRSRKNRTQFLDCSMNVKTYKALHAAYAGGITHGNRFLADTHLRGRIGHRDFRSHYPTQQRARKKAYPIGKFVTLFERKGNNAFTFDDVEHWEKTHCLLIQIAIADLHIKEGVTLPYAQTYKFWQGMTREERAKHRTIDDNGRVLHMDGASVVTLTEIDLRILRKQYNFKYLILRVFSSPRGDLPKWLTDTVDYYYRLKTELKIKIKKVEDLIETLPPGHDRDEAVARLADLSRRYNQAKRRLNGIYGMTATNPVRRELTMDDDGEWSAEVLTDALIEKKLTDYYNSKNSFMTYAWGVYCTALAREELIELVELIGYDRFIYADTDSIFYFTDDETEAKLEAWNKLHEELAIKNGAYIEVDGVKTVYDQFDTEEDDITDYKFLHAKAYAFIYKNELSCVIAGVTTSGYKGKRKISRVTELGNIDELTEDKQFVACGGTRCVYMEGKPRVEMINGHPTEISGAAIIMPTVKTLHGLISKDEYYCEFETVEDETIENQVYQ